MREIKFRAWDKSSGVGNEKMRYFHLFDSVEINLLGISDEDLFVMQYTGLKDKNGKEIYEGDIVRIENYPNNFKHSEPDFDWKVFEVEWNSHVYAFNNKAIYAPLSSYNLSTLEDFDIEIIGNIYENPDLLSTQPSQE